MARGVLARARMVNELMLALKFGHYFSAVAARLPSRHITPPPKTKKAIEKSTALVGLPGFEPRMTGPESVVLPLHQSPIVLFDGAKVEQNFLFTKDFAKKFHIFVKIIA